MDRLSVNINEATAQAILDIKSAEGISVTETIRRAVSVYRFVHDARAAGGTLLIENQGDYRELILL
jgi:hypothetical protein